MRILILDSNTDGVDKRQIELLKHIVLNSNNGIFDIILNNNYSTIVIVLA